MKNLLLVFISILCIAYTNPSLAQTGDVSDTDGTILVDDTYGGQETDIEIRNGALYINGEKVQDLNEATQLKIKKRSGQNQATGDSDGSMRLRLYNKAMLGVSVVDQNPSIKITSVAEGSGAAKAGLMQGDIITAIDNEAVINYQTLTNIMAQHKVGDAIEVAFYRNKELKKLKATLSENTQMDRIEAGTGDYQIPYQGLEELFDIPVNAFMMKAYEVNLAPRLGIDVVENTNGLEVVSMDSTGLAATSGIKMGDIIKMIKGREVLSLADFEKELDENSTEEQLAMSVFRGGELMIVNVAVPQIKRRGAF